MSEQDLFEAWWQTLNVYDPTLKALAGSAWMEAIRASKPIPPDPHIALMEAEHDDRMPRPEDPDEWVIQDRVPVRRGIDRINWVENSVDTSCEPFDLSIGKMHGYVNRHGATLYVYCRRRDLPKVEQCAACDAPAEPGTAGCKDCNEYATAICSPEPEQWPKYYKPSQPRKTNLGKYVAYYKCVEAEKGETVHTDGTSFRFSAITPEHDRTEITEAEAMWLLDQVAKPQPQPQKTRVRLWKNAYGSVMSNPDCENIEGWREIRVDSEGFYVEGGQS